MLAVDPEDNVTIHLTRGDKIENLSFYYPIYDKATETISNYVFKVGDKVSFIVKAKKGYTKEEIFRKDFTIEEETEYPVITLTGEDTKWGEMKNKKTTYWYDIVLNDDTTIVGYDDEGAKKIYLYPEGDEIDE